ncbi:MAG: glycosyltransferase, partial [Muribaculaceae bacterium]|nr:glycosyltransferase [Muribaculaceae bacterium]
YNTDYRFSADYEWCIKCLQHSRHNIYAGDEPLIEYLNEGTTTRNRWRSLMERWSIMSTYFGLWITVYRHLGFVARALKRKSL